MKRTAVTPDGVTPHSDAPDAVTPRGLTPHAVTPLAVTLLDAGTKRQAWGAMADEGELQAAHAQPPLLLGDTELARFATLRFARKQADFLLGRLVAKRALGALLDEPDPRRITIDSGVFGQPLVRHARAAGVEITLSHSHGLAIAIAHTGESPLGLDLEQVPVNSADTVLAQLQPSPAESAWLAAGTVDPAIACSVLWTAREALGKSMKIGLNCPLGTLALEHIDRTGENAWTGGYLHFPHTRCLVRISDGCAIALALPVSTQIDPWPIWP